jgi:hypothetical protein
LDRRDSICGKKVLFPAVVHGTMSLHEKCVNQQTQQRDRLESGSAGASANREADCRFPDGFIASPGGDRHAHGQGQVKAPIPLMLSHSLAIGYYGCDRNLAGRIVVGETELKPSENAWDWLGHGIYFWEDSPARALRWAEAEAGRAGSCLASGFRELDHIQICVRSSKQIIGYFLPRGNF